MTARPPNSRDPRPRIALTIGDMAGVGPEVIARAWDEGALLELARPVVIGNPSVLGRAVRLIGGRAVVETVPGPSEAEPSSDLIPCIDPSGPSLDLDDLAPGRVDPRAGRAAHDALVAAIDLALGRQIDALVTLPLNKEALHAAGVRHPGHTEVLAERCGVPDHAMMLYLPSLADASGAGLGVLHVTLHVALRKVFDRITTDAVASKIALADRALRPLTGGRAPRVAVAALNPHAGEGGLFGDEETRVIRPAVIRAAGAGVDVVGPIAADTLFSRAIRGEFDGVVAMYHDQGHVALKTLGFDRAVNVTLGLPIVRTSVAHGTAYDIAWTGRASSSSLIEAVRVATRIVRGRRRMGLGPGTD